MQNTKCKCNRLSVKPFIATALLFHSFNHHHFSYWPEFDVQAPIPKTPTVDSNRTIHP